MEQHSDSSSPWLSLPRELLSNIATRLNSRVDVLRLRAVCTLWRSSLPLPLSRKHSPVPYFPNLPPVNTASPAHSFFSFNEITIYSFQPLTKISNSWNTTKSWFIGVKDPEEGSTKMILMDPLPNSLIDVLPKSCPKVLNLLDYRVSEIAKFFDLNFVSKSYFEAFDLIFYKSVLRFATDCSNGGFTAAAITPFGQLGVWKKGQHKWTLINDPPAEYFDVVCYKDKFYVLDTLGRVKVVDFSFNVTQIASPLHLDSPTGNPFQNKHFVESRGDLLVVDICADVEQDFDESDTNYPIRLKVYRLNEQGTGWVPVDSLGDQALFLGFLYTFSVSAQDFPGCKGNCIYFRDDIFKRGDLGKDVGIYDLDDGSAGPVSSFMGYSKIFWPPPTWLKHVSS